MRYLRAPIAVFAMALSLLVPQCASTSAVGAQTAGSSPRAVYNFDPGWRLHVGDVPGAEAAAFDDSGWKPVTLPNAFNEDSAFKVSIHDLPNGVAWYRKRFTVPANAAGKQVFLEFEGVRQAAHVYLNGQDLGLHEDGVTAFGCDLSAYVKPGAENVVAVRIDSSYKYREQATNTSYQWNHSAFNANYGGINKHVRLIVADKLYQTLPLYSSLGTTGVYVYGKNYDIPHAAVDITVQSEVANAYARPMTFHYAARVLDLSGKLVASLDGGDYTATPGAKVVATASGHATLQFWSWGYGALYDVVSTLSVNGISVDQVTTRTGFRKTKYANGEIRLNDRVMMVHGYAQRSTNEWPALGSAVPDWLSDYSNRLMVDGNANMVRWMHVTPAKQEIESCDRVGLPMAMPAGDSEKDGTGRQWDQRVAVMRDSIIYNRNNPSILFYECGNKGISEEHMAEMKAVRDKFDPFGGRAIGAREMLGSQTAEYGGEMLYINKSAGKPLWAMEYSRDEAVRKFWDALTPPNHPDGPEYNRNQDSFAIENVRRWYDYWQQRPGGGKRVSSGGVKIIFSDSNTHFRGVDNYRRSGAVDAVRLPKDAYYANQVMWDGWVETEHPNMHIVGHWNYADSVTKDVSVVSNTDSVKLFLNGVSLGEPQRDYRFLFAFKSVAWKPGKLEAVGYDADGKPVASAALTTTGVPVALRLTPITDPAGWRADGNDVALVTVEAVDASGQRCPTAMNDVQFKLDGPAEWRGGIAQAPGNGILATTLPVECGVNRVIVRSTPTAGKVTLTATADGLAPATLVMNTKPVAITNGLAAYAPDESLAPNLSKGPTPPTSSTHPWRVPLTVASVTAGSDEADANNTIDDDEKTGWSSDADTASAWISYAFDKPSTPNQLVVKFGAFRNRSYRIAVFVDDAKVWQGSTLPSLGYVEIPLKPTMGKTLKIQAVGKAEAGNDFNDIVEVTGKTLQDQATKAKSSSNLAILETEIYAAK